MLPLRLVTVTLSAAIILTGLTLPTPPAVAGYSYERVVDITFPTRAGAQYSNDYHGARGGGTRRHGATDLLGTRGWAVYAAKSGRVLWSPDYEHSSAGWAIQVRGDDGRLYAYYHLGPSGGRRSQAIARGVHEGSRVRRGQVIGYLGDSGNAGGTVHLHFEIHDDRVRDPYGGHRMNPYPSLRGAERGGDYATGRGQRPSRSGGRSNDSMLERGDRGAAVARWQRKLNKLRRHDIAADGIFGSITDGATRDFQRSHNLAADGIVGPQTRAAMRRDLSGASGDGSDRHSSMLRRGDRGRPVVVWQQKLNRVRSQDIAADGIFGSITDGATRDFQRSRGLASDGIVGPRTRAAMRRALH